MQSQPGRLAMVLALAATSIPLFAATPPSPAKPPADTGADAETADYDEDAALEAYQRNEMAVYDALITDPAPRMQALASRVYIEDSGNTPTVLRPKREDVIARAAQFAPDDVLVQWIAVSQGSFASSSCGPTHWPEAEVSNLLRLEPDNAAAWQYGVALARAKGDEAGIDDALSRMAAARRADDHLTDELVAWTVAFEPHSEVAKLSIPPWFDKEVTPKQGALIAGLQRTGYRYSAAESALEAVCKPDAASDRVWQRLGWCADAARLLAQKGSSLELREQGLKLLATIGERSDAIEPMQRQYDWLEVHSANPLRGFQEPPDSADVVVADWHGAASEIAAIERHLRHLGLPSTPPESWSKEVSPTDANDTAESDSAKRTMQLYVDYLQALFDDMRASPKAEQRVFAALNEQMSMAARAAADGNAESKAETATVTAEAFTELADGNPGNLKVQWMIGTSVDARITEDTKAGAIARMQVAESDNAAAWALSLPMKGDVSADIADTTLRRMASSTRYDSHSVDAASVMLDAMSKRPLPEEIASAWSKLSGNDAIPADVSAKVLALSMAAAMSSTDVTRLSTACSPGANATPEAARREACITTARLMVEKSPTLIGVGVGESVLRKLDALDETSAARARHVWWWQNRAMPGESAGDIGAYLDDYFASGNEIEAVRLNAERLGKAEPPANWKSPNERKARAASK